MVFLGGNVGKGYYHYSVSLLNSLAKRKELKLTPYFLKDVSEEEIRPNEKPGVMAFPTWLRRWCPKTAYLFWAILFVLKLVVKKPVVIHFNVLFDPPSNLLFIYIARLIKVKVVITVHEISRNGMVADKNRPPWKEKLRTRALKAANCLIVHSLFTKNLLKKEISLKNQCIKIIPHGNYSIFPQTFGVMTASSETKNIVFFGPKFYKGFDLFAEYLLSANGPPDNSKVLIAGDPDRISRGYIRQLEQFDRIFISKGYVRDREIKNIFVPESLVMLPYRDGETSGALHLAMSHGCCPVVSHHPYFEENLVHEKNGIFLPYLTSSDFQDVIAEGVSRPKLIQEICGNALRQEKSARYNWDNIAAQYCAVY